MEVTPFKKERAIKNLGSVSDVFLWLKNQTIKQKKMDVKFKISKMTSKSRNYYFRRKYLFRSNYANSFGKRNT